MQLKETASFACPIDILWSHLEEPQKQKLWMKGLLSNETTSPGVEGVGSTFRMKIQEGRKVADYDGEVTAYEKPRRLEILIWGGGLPKDAKMRADYRLAEAGGRTTLDYLCTLEAPKMGVFMRMMMGLFKVFGRMQLRGFLKALKKHAEGEANARVA